MEEFWLEYHDYWGKPFDVPCTRKDVIDIIGRKELNKGFKAVKSVVANNALENGLRYYFKGKMLNGLGYIGVTFRFNHE